VLPAKGRQGTSGVPLPETQGLVEKKGVFKMKWKNFKWG
jgi:hypothetical protein